MTIYWYWNQAFSIIFLLLSQQQLNDIKMLDGYDSVNTSTIIKIKISEETKDLNEQNYHYKFSLTKNSH